MKQAAKSKRNSAKGGAGSASGSGASRLVDVTQMRAKFNVKINGVIKMSQAQLAEVLTLAMKYKADETELMEKFDSPSLGVMA